MCSDIGEPSCKFCHSGRCPTYHFSAPTESSSDTNSHCYLRGDYNSDLCYSSNASFNSCSECDFCCSDSDCSSLRTSEPSPITRSPSAVTFSSFWNRFCSAGTFPVWIRAHSIGDGAERWGYIGIYVFQYLFQKRVFFSFSTVRRKNLWSKKRDMIATNDRVWSFSADIKHCSCRRMHKN